MFRDENSPGGDVMDQLLQAAGLVGEGRDTLGLYRRGQKRSQDKNSSPENLMIQLALAQATYLARAGRYLEAKRLLAEIIPNPETVPAILDLQARMCAQQGQLGEARSFWMQALQLDPTNEVYAAGLKRAAERRSWRWPWSPNGA